MLKNQLLGCVMLGAVMAHVLNHEAALQRKYINELNIQDFFKKRFESRI